MNPIKIPLLPTHPHQEFEDKKKTHTHNLYTGKLSLVGYSTRRHRIPKRVALLRSRVLRNGHHHSLDQLNMLNVLVCCSQLATTAAAGTKGEAVLVSSLPTSQTNERTDNTLCADQQESQRRRRNEKPQTRCVCVFVCL